MKLRIASDLHFEFMRDGGDSLLTELIHEDFDVLVLAGDVCSFKGLNNTLGRICEAVSPRPVVFVLGNHEAYGGSWMAAVEVLRRVEARCPNLHGLEQQTVTLMGQRFVGCTLWYPHSGVPGRMDRSIGDFQAIKDVYDFLPDTARSSAAFLAQTVQPGDVVVTHYLPHPLSVHPQYQGSPLNRYFLHNLQHTVENNGAKLWAHGHTHKSMDYRAGTTRVVCNPFGYIGGMAGEPNDRFNGSFTVEVLPDHQPVEHDLPPNDPSSVLQ